MHPDILPDLRGGPRILMYSDYSGSAKGEGFQTLSYLLLNEHDIAQWDRARRHVRTEFLEDRGEMSFKSLHDRVREEALLPFLTAVNELKGLSWRASFGQGSASAG